MDSLRQLPPAEAPALGAAPMPATPLPPTEVAVDPWLKGPGSEAPVPADAVLVCEYWLDVEMWDVVESAHLRRTPGADELWLGGECGEGRAVVAPPRPDAVTAARELFGALVRSRAGFGWPREFRKAGLLDESAYAAVVAGVEAELDARAAKAATNETEIVRVARDLGLNPEPTGEGSAHWRARCPGTQHQLLIGAGSGQFGCGYCRVKGGVNELLPGASYI